MVMPDAEPSEAPPRTVHCAVIGWPLEHSLSPRLFRRAFAARGVSGRYVAIPVPADGLAGTVSAFRESDLRGFNVTSPHKEAMLALVDTLSPEAGRIGAVNCVTRAGDRLTGHNTDAGAFTRTLRDIAGFDPAGRRVVVLGAGGAARAVVDAVVAAGADDIAVIARRSDRARSLAADLARGNGAGESRRAAGSRRGAIRAVPGPDIERTCRAAHLLVNATPAGMRGGPPLSSLPRGIEDALHPGLLVYDLVYEPRETPLLAAARASGAAGLDGLAMLAFQAAEAFRWWTAQIMDDFEMLALAEAAAGDDSEATGD